MKSSPKLTPNLFFFFQVPLVASHRMFPPPWPITFLRSVRRNELPWVRAWALPLVRRLWSPSPRLKQSTASGGLKAVRYERFYLVIFQLVISDVITTWLLLTFYSNNLNMTGFNMQNFTQTFSRCWTHDLAIANTMLIQLSYNTDKASFTAEQMFVWTGRPDCWFSALKGGLRSRWGQGVYVRLD